MPAKPKGASAARNGSSMMQLAAHLLATPLDQLGARERQVIERAVRRHREPLPRATLPEEPLTVSERLADNVAAIGGSWGFIIGFALALASWALLNAWLLSRPFDPYPFIFLNLLLSMLAAVQAPIIMMSQNRLAATDRRQARRDFEINLKAELEILALHAKLDQLLARPGPTDARGGSLRATTDGREAATGRSRSAGKDQE